MKLRLSVSEERYDELAEALTRAGFELDDDAELVLLENDRFPTHLPVRDGKGNRVHLAVEDVIYIESYGHTVEVHGVDGTYQTGDRSLVTRPCGDSGRQSAVPTGGSDA